MNCRSCGEKVEKFFSLGDMPSVNHFLKKDELASEIKVDLSLSFCPKCYLVQLLDTINPSDLFEDYIYFSSISKALVDYFATTANHLINKLHLDDSSYIVEIASNDGTMLENFKRFGMKILGIDPAKNIAKYANNRGIITIDKFFNLSLAKELVEKEQKPDLIYGANVLAHVPKIIDFSKAVNLLLADKGTAVFEFPYIKGLLEKKFDTIYHEHVFYYSLLSVSNIFSQSNMEVYDVEETPTQGGSLRIYIAHKGVFPTSNNVKKLLIKEKKLKYNLLNTYKNMAKDVQILKESLLTKLKELKKDNKKIIAYGAAAKGVVLMNYFGLGSEYFDYIVDKAPQKQGLYTPGVHLKVYGPKQIKKEKPDYIVILCWNIADEIIAQESAFKLAGGKFIIPVPDVVLL